MGDAANIAGNGNYRLTLFLSLPPMRQIVQVGSVYTIVGNNFQDDTDNTESMSNYSKGKIYEDYVEYVYRFLLDLETKQNDEPIIISRNVKLAKSGYTNELDIYYEFKKANVLHRVAIECKNQTSPVEIGLLRDFQSKIFDFHNITGVFISNSGYQTGAKNFAKDKGILAITTDELPSLLSLIGQRSKQLFLPEDYVKGEPFYILMETHNGELNGSYHLVKFANVPPSIMLFLSKKQAQDFINLNKEKNLVVRSLRQEAFDYMILFAKRVKAKFQVIFKKDSEKGDYMSFFIEPNELKEQFCDK